MPEFINWSVVTMFICTSIRFGMPFLLGSTGEILTEKSGHLNLGIPGTMSVGAASGCLAETLYLNAIGGIDKASPIIAVILPILAAFAGGVLMGLIYSFLTVTLHANQNVTGLAITTFGAGLSAFMVGTIKGYGAASKYFTAYLPFADKLGVPGKIFFSYGIFIWLSILIAVGSWFVLKRTRVGLNLRAVGENPATADAAGINVSLYRYGATLIGSGIAGVGGICYIMDNLSGNWEYSIEAIGWLALALVIFTLWNPNLSILGSILFGALRNCSSYIKIGGAGGVYFTYFSKALPYLVTIVVLIITSAKEKRESQAPGALGLNYFREDR